MIKLLIGGSPCTYWSVAQKKGREVEAKGLGWELFKNYLIAKEKFKPDLFLYENNKSAAQPIKDQISRELGVDLMHINSALVSAQNRQRFYAFNWNVDQPADRGIMLKDILETTTSEKGYELRAPAVGVGCRNRREDDDQTTDLSSAPAEIKEAILKNDQALSPREADPPENCVDAEEQPKPSATTDCQCVTVVDVLLDLRDERLRLSQINGKNRRYGDEVRALEYAIDILEAVT